MLAEPIAITARVGKTLDAMGVDWLIGGSVASSLHGIPRATQDIDLVADLGPEHAGPLSEALANDFYADDGMIRDAIQRRTSFNIIHLPTMTKIDVFVLKRDAISQSEMQRRRYHAIGPEGIVRLPVASPEDIILQKLDWYRRGGHVSERQWRDVLGVIAVSGAGLDRVYLRTQAEAWGLLVLLEEALTGA
jgi:hypothetical protein